MCTLVKILFEFLSKILKKKKIKLLFDNKLVKPTVIIFEFEYTISHIL